MAHRWQARECPHRIVERARGLFPADADAKPWMRCYWHCTECGTWKIFFDVRPRRKDGTLRPNGGPRNAFIRGDEHSIGKALPCVPRKG